MNKIKLTLMITITLLLSFTSMAMALESITVGSGETYTVSSDMEAYLDVEDGGTLIIESGATFYPCMFGVNYGTIVIESGAAINNGIVNYGTIENYGNLFIPTFTPDFSGSGLGTVSLYNHGIIINHASGYITVNSQSFTENYGTIDNYGTFIICYLAGFRNEGVVNAYVDSIFIGYNPTNYAPVADADGPYSEKTNVIITFDGTNSTDDSDSIISYEWDFGDGNTGTGATPTHAYTTADEYTVTLTVTDDCGAKDTDTTTVTVTTPSSSSTPSQDIPEFPTIALPIAAIIGLAFIFRKRE